MSLLAGPEEHVLLGLADVVAVLVVRAVDVVVHAGALNAVIGLLAQAVDNNGLVRTVDGAVVLLLRIVDDNAVVACGADDDRAAGSIEGGVKLLGQNGTAWEADPERTEGEAEREWTAEDAELERTAELLMWELEDAAREDDESLRIIPTYLLQNGVVSLEATCRIVPASSTQPGGIAEAPSRDKMYTLSKTGMIWTYLVPIPSKARSASAYGVSGMSPRWRQALCALGLEVRWPAGSAEEREAGALDRCPQCVLDRRLPDLWVFVHTLSAEQRALESAPQRAVSYFVPCGRMEVRGLPALGTWCAIGAAAGSKEDNRKVLRYLVVLDVQFVNGGNRAEMLHVFFLRSGSCATEAIFHYNTSLRYPFAPSKPCLYLWEFKRFIWDSVDTAFAHALHAGVRSALGA
ncbi:hypothetical protein C8R43DRAFT_1131913 [Mycena crocata]|nr:hypothetical protein C8R43DRAFT_1131913 [Mycena crocata]